MSEDLRIVKTKKALSEALFSMLQRMSFDELSVNALCCEAGIRRATFYKHFKDKYDFLTYIISALRDEFDEEFYEKPKPQAAVEYYTEYLSAFIEFLDEHRAVIMGILASDMRVSLVGLIMQQNFCDTERRLAESEKAGMTLPASPRTVASLLTGGFGNIILLWLNDGMKTPAAEVIAEATALLRKIIEP